MANWLEMVRLRSCASTLEAQSRRKQGMHLDTPSGARLFINCLWSSRVETSIHLNVFLSKLALQSVMQKKNQENGRGKKRRRKTTKAQKRYEICNFIFVLASWASVFACDLGYSPCTYSVRLWKGLCGITRRKPFLSMIPVNRHASYKKIHFDCCLFNFLLLKRILVCVSPATVSNRWLSTVI